MHFLIIPIVVELSALYADKMMLSLVKCKKKKKKNV